MIELVQANWVLLVIALVIGVLVAWWIFAKSRRTRIEPGEEEETPAKARRNQALINAPPAAAPSAGVEINASDVEEAERMMPPAAPMGLAGIGEAVQAAARPAAVDDAPDIDAPPEAAPPRAPDPEAPAAPPSEPSSPTGEHGDDLSRIKGLGPKLQAQLQALGVTSFAQIAAWDEADVDRIDAHLGRFQGRIRRDNWPEQARLLAAEDMPAYEARFGKL